jgi:hypothetical protein
MYSLHICAEGIVKNMVAVSTMAGLFALAAGSSAQTIIDESAAPLAPRQAGAVLREIDDPAAHGSWLLVRDPVHLAGPGRWIWAPRGGSSRESSAGVAAYTGVAIKPVILAGDRLVVEEETSVVEARLAATALGPAPAGAALRVRIEIGGKVVRAIAIGPGRARLAPELEAAEP